jgi:DNA-binding protein H-NS
MAIDLGNMSLKELKALHTQVAREIEGFVERKKREAVKELEGVAKSLGYSLDELVSAKPTRKRAPAKPKYANPANKSDTWTGRGRRPRWVEAALKSGKSLDDLAI